LDSTTKNEEVKADIVKNSEVVDDFFRNFLASKGFLKTLDAFQVLVMD
jgi:hypothetical protein